MKEDMMPEEGTDLDKWHSDMMKEYGWYSHIVFDDFKQVPNGINIHTHGIAISFDHPDFQVCVPLDGNIAQEILGNLVYLIKDGKRFSSNEYYFDIIETWPITFIEATESRRPVLRLIFPDQDGCLDPEGMKDPFRTQYQL